jgi:limonene-1,2-epoxide hydrolase
MPEQEDLQVVESFYKAFKNHDAKAMNQCYHEKATFSDPVFQNLTSDEVKSMWSMLIERAGGNLDIQYSNIRVEGDKIHAHWEAKYEFSKTKRHVHNLIDAEFNLENGKIIEHLDHFSFHKWAGMALGPIGVLLGGTSYLKNKVRKQTSQILAKYMKSKH